MEAEVKTNILATSETSHTGKSKSDSSSFSPSGIVKKVKPNFVNGFLAWVHQPIRPPPPKKLGPPDGLPITSPRIKLRDGRYMSYIEFGVPKEVAKYKIIYVHGLNSCKHFAVIVTEVSPALIQDLGICIVSFDRPGYGESDPDPNRSIKSSALDIEELADQLGLGSKFYVVGFSMGGLMAWPCLKYIPHRLAGVSLLAPGINHWWPNLPANLSKEAYYKQFQQRRWSQFVAHYLPWMTYWWSNAQRKFPFSSLITNGPGIISRQDIEILPKITAGKETIKRQMKQQGEYESFHRDMIVGFGTSEFDPIELENPFPCNEGSVHIWMGDEDDIVSVKLQRYIAQQLPWIKYHEVKGAGHLFPYADGMSEDILKALLLVKS